MDEIKDTKIKTNFTTDEFDQQLSAEDQMP